MAFFACCFLAATKKDRGFAGLQFATGEGEKKLPKHPYIIFSVYLRAKAVCFLKGSWPRTVRYQRDRSETNERTEETESDRQNGISIFRQN